MAIASATDPRRHDAIRTCIQALRQVADYKFPSALDQHMQDLGERKEFLNPGEQEQLLALVSFAQDRTIEKLQAELALRQLAAAFPQEVHD
jgi:hypothetical protein